MNPPVVMLVWEDATVMDDSPWTTDKDHSYSPHIVHQVGFLLAETEQGVILSQGWHPDVVAARDQIPRGMIRSITYLEPVKAKKKAK